MPYPLVRRLSVFLLLLCLAFAACQPPLEQREVRDGTTLLRFTARKGSDKREGKMLRLNATGDTVLIESNYRDGKLEGTERFFFSDGKTEIEQTYHNDLLEGPYIKYYHDGTKAVEAVYHEGKMQGSFRRYYPNGQLREEVQMIADNENGPFKEFYPNGKLKTEGTYKGGDKEDGPLTMYDSTGTLLRRMVCRNGVCKTVQ